MAMRWIMALCLAIVAGCSTSRQITISARPADAKLAIDGVDKGAGPLTEKLVFKGRDDVHEVTASRLGYTSRTVQITRDEESPDLLIELQPQTKDVTFQITPVPATITIDGKTVTPTPVSHFATSLPFTVDAANHWTKHVVQASHPGYETFEQVVQWEDPTRTYTLALDAMRKDLSITTTPAGAQVSIDGKLLGPSPVHFHGYPFPVDPKTGRFVPRQVTVNQPGYDPVTSAISWDNGRGDYHINLRPKTKTVRITSDPPGATVSIDGQVCSRDPSGVSTATLAFPPVNAKGDLKAYTAVVTKKTADSEWFPKELPIGWEAGKTDYSVTLREVKTRPVALLRVKPVRTDEGWQIEPETIQTIAMKDVTEGSAVQPPVRITAVSKDSTIDTLTVSPDGQYLLFTTVSALGRTDVRSRMQMVRADGSGGPSMFGDGRSLDLTPSFTPDGSQIVFSSNRGGRHLSVWQIAANGEGGVTQLTSGDTSDLWPTVDSDPKPRLFYQALVDSRPDPRIYMTQLGTTLRTDLTQSGGEQPRVSPKADSVVFTLANEKTGKRDIYKMSDRGGGAVNLTNEPDYDHLDPVWSKDGSRIAYTSDRGADSEGRHNFDIYLLDLAHPEKPLRLTVNGSWDDCPAFDPSGKFVYFRSNRGGAWGIWRIAVKDQAVSSIQNGK